MAFLISHSATIYIILGIIVLIAGYVLSSLFSGSKVLSPYNMLLYRTGVALMFLGPALAMYGFTVS